MDGSMLPWSGDSRGCAGPVIISRCGHTRCWPPTTLSGSADGLVHAQASSTLLLHNKKPILEVQPSIRNTWPLRFASRTRLVDEWLQPALGSSLLSRAVRPAIGVVYHMI